MTRGIIFDLDGTLLDTTEGIIESVEYTVEKMGLPHLPHEVLLTFIGPPIIESFKNKYKMSDEEAKYATNMFRTYYKEKALFKAKLYLGIFELLDTLRLRGLNIGVATYKREDYAIKLLYKFGFEKYM